MDDEFLRIFEFLKLGGASKKWVTKRMGGWKREIVVNCYFNSRGSIVAVEVMTMRHRKV